MFAERGCRTFGVDLDPASLAQRLHPVLARLMWADGWVKLLNPSEQMSVIAATAFADQCGLICKDRDFLIGWAGHAEAHQRWSEADLARPFSAAGLVLHETVLKIGPGLARFARGRRS
jgi:hypothetical protein